MPDKEEKQSASAMRNLATAKQTAAPMEGVYGQYYTPAFQQWFNALKMPSMRGEFAQQERAQEGQLSRYGLGGSGVAESRRRGQAGTFADVLGRMNFQQAQGYGQLAGAAGNAGMSAANLKMGAESDWQNLLGRQSAAEDAQMQADREAEANAIRQVIEGTADVGMAIASGDATIPMTAAKYAQKAGQAGLKGSAKAAEYMPGYANSNTSRRLNSYFSGLGG